jgi:hypothetical protein
MGEGVPTFWRNRSTHDSVRSDFGFASSMSSPLKKSNAPAIPVTALPLSHQVLAGEHSAALFAANLLHQQILPRELTIDRPKMPDGRT